MWSVVRYLDATEDDGGSDARLVRNQSELYKELVGSDDTGARPKVGTRGTAGLNRTEKLAKANKRAETPLIAIRILTAVKLRVRPSPLNGAETTGNSVFLTSSLWHTALNDG